ncbi:MAG: hypothetical protein LBF06_15480 [Pseudomonas sp.]|jgi:hypothetical protein|nr:hypothetical protein [Pseudomonas sp.]
MPAEKRFSNTDPRDVFIRLNPLGLGEAELRKESTGLEDPRTHSDYLLFLAGYRETHPEPQPHPEPIAWMVGTAFWWTKEEAERDAAATGKPMTPFGPMTGTYTPAEQHQGEPVAVLYANGTVLTKTDCGDVFDICCKVETPLYTHADQGELERLKSIERSYGLREALLDQVKGERDRMIARTLELADQLANQDALLHKLKETIQREYWDEYAGLDETRELIDAALAASAEPEATS